VNLCPHCNWTINLNTCHQQYRNYARADWRVIDGKPCQHVIIYLSLAIKCHSLYMAIEYHALWSISAEHYAAALPTDMQLAYIPALRCLTNIWCVTTQALHKFSLIVDGTHLADSFK